MNEKELSLRETQIASLDILKDIDLVCRTNSIKYYVFFGTLIGVVRHKGFIPWDDDIDIVMLREDYNRFLNIYKDKGKYRLINFENEPKCPFMITRVSDDRYQLISDYGPQYKIGTFVDVYPLDKVGEKVEEAKYASKICRKYSSRLNKSLERNIIGVIKDTHNGIKKWLLLFTYFVPKIMGASYYRNKLLGLEKQFNQGKSKYLGCVTWAMLKTEYYDCSWFEETIDMKFEELNVMVPKEYDKILTQNFGDYMKLPPEKDRIAHHYYRIVKRSC